MEKEAFGEQLANLWHQLGSSPGGQAAQYGLAGAGLGAGAGLLASQFNPNRDERKPISSALTGALAGGALGGGLGLASPFLREKLHQYALNGHEMDPYAAQLEGVDPMAVQQELAGRGGPNWTTLAAGGTGGAAAGGLPSALHRGAKATTPFEPVSRTDFETRSRYYPDGNLQEMSEGVPHVTTTTSPAEVMRRRLAGEATAGANVGVGQQLRATGEAFGGGGLHSRNPVNWIRDYLQHGGQRNEALRRSAAPLMAEEIGALDNSQVRQMFAKGMSPLRLAKSPGAWAGLLAGLGLPYLAHQLGGVHGAPAGTQAIAGG